MNSFFLRKAFVFFLFAFSIHFLFVFATSRHDELTAITNGDGLPIANDDNVNSSDRNKSLYELLNLSQLNLGKEAFDRALEGYNCLSVAGKLSNNQYLSIVDFSQPSSQKRLYVIDMKAGKLVFHTYVSHGRNSGREMAREFSNDAESNKSSLGFFITGDTYMGKHGFSLRLLGQERGINDNACNRAIVMHSAEYVSEAAIRMQGFAGRSLGCPALPVELYKPIIEKIKSGSCLFLYSPDKYYSSHSTFFKKS